MATQVLYTQHFPGEPAAVWQMLCDPAYITLKGMRSGSLEVSPDVLERDGRTVIISRRRMPANLPGFMKRFVGDVLALNETQTWEEAEPDGSRRGTFIIDFGGQPMAFSGTLLLKPIAEGTSVTTEGALKASLPIVGRKAEAVASDWAVRYLRKEESVAADWFAGDRG